MKPEVVLYDVEKNQLFVAQPDFWIGLLTTYYGFELVGEL